MDNDDVLILSTALGWSAFALHIAAFLVFNWKTMRGESRPNAATWAIWAFVATLNCLSYFAMSDDWVKSLQPLAGSLACVGTFGFALAKGRLTRLRGLDLGILTIGLAAVLAWFVYRSATSANLILQAAFVVSFIPTFRDVWRRPEGESATPWFMWGSAYVLLVATVFLRWSGNAAEAVYPLNSFFFHSLVGVLIVVRRRSAP